MLELNYMPLKKKMFFTSLLVYMLLLFFWGEGVEGGGEGGGKRQETEECRKVLFILSLVLGVVFVLFMRWCQRIKPEDLHSLHSLSTPLLSSISALHIDFFAFGIKKSKSKNPGSTNSPPAVIPLYYLLSSVCTPILQSYSLFSSHIQKGIKG